MRTLKFIVDGQIIKQDPSCDFTDLVPGTEGYLKAKFSFSPEWTKLVKVAAFYSTMGKEYPPQKLDDDDTCLIPAEALARRVFKVRIMGRGHNLKMTTNKLAISQNGGKV